MLYRINVLITVIIALLSVHLHAAEIGMKTSGVVTHSDWGHMAVVDPVQFMDMESFWGTNGVEYIIDRCKNAGMTRVYWRIFDGSHVTHKTEFDNDGDSVPDVFITNGFYHMPIAVTRDLPHFSLIDSNSTSREIRLLDSNAATAMPVTHELFLKVEGLDGDPGTVNYTLRYSDGGGQYWDLLIMGDGTLKNSAGTSQLSFDPTTYYHYYRFVCTNAADVRVIMDQNTGTQIVLTPQSGGGNYFSIISGASPTATMRVDNCQVTSGAHVLPSKFPYEEWDRLSSNYGSELEWYHTHWYTDWENQPFPNRFSIGEAAGDEHGRMNYKAAYEQEPERFGVGKDVLSSAVDYSHSQDMEIYGWFSIGEENHYGNGPISRFATLYPEHLEVDRYDRTWYGRAAFGIPEVRAYKLSAIREIINEYGADGIFLDLNRRGMRIPYVTGCEAVVDGTGTSLFGYDSYIRGAYQTQYGVDPMSIPNNTETWIQFRCDNIWTQFLRDIKAEFPDVPVIPMIYYYDAVTARRIDLFDWETWLNDGLVDGICFLMNTQEGWMCGGGWNDRPNPPSWAADVMEARKAEINGRAEVIAGIYDYNITADELDTLTYHTYRGGADELMWWETGTLEYADYGGSVWDKITELSPVYYKDHSVEIDTGGFVTIYWRGLTGENYALYYSDDLASGWTVVPGQGNISGVDEVMEWTDNGTVISPDITTTGKRFYKVVKLN